MKLNEATATARRIGPIKAIDADGNPVVDFSAGGAKEISVNDGAFGAAGGAVVAIGGTAGYVYYQASLADASVRGFVDLKLAGSAQGVTLREEVEIAPQGIPVGTNDAALLHSGAIRLVDDAGNKLASLVGVVVEVTINGSNWAAPAGNLTLIEAGYADYAPNASEVVNRGWLAVKVSGVCQEFVFRVDITDPADVALPTCAVVSPAIGDIDPDETLVVDVTDDIAIAYIAVYVTYTGTLRKETVFRRGAFEPGYSIGSAIVPIAGGYRLHIKRDTDWPEGSVTITIDPVDTVGNVGV